MTATVADEQLYTPAEVGAMFRVAASTLKRWAAEGRFGELGVIYTRSGMRFPQSTVDALWARES
jgi:predicted site-specific integrase-resolvase